MTPDNEPEKLDGHSLDIAEERRKELLRLFPDVRTEGGKIDFDKLKLTLGEMVDVGRERYGMNWPGKAECFRTIQATSTATLRPCREESVDFDTTQNLIIEGDNLEVLKLLQKAYLGKVKMIYIDPPYNTGNDFIYSDDYADSIKAYLEFTGQVDSEGRRFSTNTEADGRFHSKWLSMMYPRLSLARNLLRDDGVIFVSIDDNEISALRKLMDEVFGEENFVATLIWQKVYSPKNSARHFSEDHDYIVTYAKRADEWRPYLLPRTEDMQARYSNPDNDSRGDWKPGDLSARNYYADGTYSITCPSGRIIPGPPRGSYWRYSKQRFEDLDRDNRIWWGETGNNIPAIKRFLGETKAGVVPQTLWQYSDVGHTQDAKKELIDAVAFESSDNVVDSVKPTALIQRMLQVATSADSDDVVLDFFGGTGTTAQAVMQANTGDGGTRRFVVIQLPERLPIPEQRLKTLADITAQRARTVSARLKAKLSGLLKEEGTNLPDLGFRILKLAESNFGSWAPPSGSTVPEVLSQLQLHVSHVRVDRTDDDLLFEILLKSGYPPSERIETLEIADNAVNSVADGLFLICLARTLTLEAIRGMAERSPERVVCLDAAFDGNDQLKANAVQIFKSRNIVFKTV